jgi:lipoate-protein ligase A
MHWEILDTGTRSAEENMQIDAHLLEELKDEAILHFYDWKRTSATYGYFLDPQEFINMEAAKLRGLDLGRRSTGGGIVFHIWDMAFSVLVPSVAPIFSDNTLENYSFVNHAVLRAVKKFLNIPCTLTPDNAPLFDRSCGRFCMAQPTKYDLIYEGKKIAGAAQRKRKQGYLHQGTIALCMPDEEYLQEILLPGSRVYEAMQAYTYPLLGDTATVKDLEEAKVALRALLITSFKGSL